MIEAGNKHFSRFGALWALIAGLSLALAFSPFNLFALGIISPALLLAIFLFSTNKQAFWRGYLYGLGYFGAGVYWVFISIHTYGQAPFLLALFITVAFIAFLALFPAVTGYLLNRLFPKNNLSKCILAFPAIWLFLELLRSWLLSGFPWILLGYSQVEAPLRGLAPIFSVFGVSLATAMTAGLLVSIIYLSKRAYNSIGLLIIIALLWAASAGLGTIHWTTAAGQPIKVSLVQGNIFQSVKWQPEQVKKTIDTYYNLTQQHWDSQIVVWPEAAITVPKNYVPTLLNELDTQAKTNNSSLITGIPIMENGNYYNGMIVVGNGEGQYVKRHLVPFGEYLPLRFLFGWFNKYVLIPGSDMQGGAIDQGKFIAANIPIAPYICYEIIFSREVIDTLQDAQLIVVISDDSWFGRSLAPAQHLQMAQMRAVETGRYVLSATNDGVTAIIKPDGEIANFIEPFTIGVLTDTVQPMQGKTPLMIVGFWPVYLIGLIFLLIAFVRQKKSCSLD